MEIICTFEGLDILDIFFFDKSEFLKINETDAIYLSTVDVFLEEMIGKSIPFFGFIKVVKIKKTNNNI